MTTEPRATTRGTSTDASDASADLHCVVAAQADLIEQLQQRLERLEGERAEPVGTGSTPAPPLTIGATPAAPAAGGETPATNVDDGIASSSLDASTSRRHLMTKGAAAAASAVVGTAVVGLATASPAAAASGTFDGNPAVSATANPGSATAIVATSESGHGVHGQANGGEDATGVWGQNLSTSGDARGVAGTTHSPDGYAVLAINFATTGSALAVVGQSESPSGIAIEGRAIALDGETTGVKGTSSSPQSGRGVIGHNSATTGDTAGVLGRVESSGVGKGVAGLATAATGANFGVWGLSESNAGTGVYGGAYAISGSTFGVVGETDSPVAIAVRAIANNSGTGIASTSDRTQLRFDGAPAAPPGAGLARLKGEMVFDANADLWLCVVAGTPGTWRKLAGPATAGAFTILPSTIRIYDSRPDTNPPNVTKGQLGNLATRTIDAKIGGAVPAGATAVLVNLTIVNTTGSGYLGLFKNGITYPGNSTINWNQPNTLLANSAVVALDDQARFAVKANTGFCDFVIDAIGYYR